MISILPAILAENATELHERLTFPGFWEPGMTAHIDVLDGSLFGATCFCDPAAVAPHQPDSQALPHIELHCMVQNPLPIITAWHTLVPSTVRAIVHTEIPHDLDTVLASIRDLGLETGVALSPNVPVDQLKHLAQLPSRALMMGVQPGASGQSFLGEPILSKIRRCRALFPNITIAVDGGVTADLVPALQHAGADALVMNSAIWGKITPHQAYRALAHSALLPEENTI